MKAVGAPIAALDGNALPLDVDAGEQDDAAPGAGFDALLALVNAQAANTPAPVKVMAPSVGVQSIPVTVQPGKGGSEAMGADAATAHLLSAKRADVGPTQAFLPWLDAAPVVKTAPVLPSSDGESDVQNANSTADVLPDAQLLSPGTAVKEAVAAKAQFVQPLPAQPRTSPVLAPAGKELSASLETSPKDGTKSQAVRKGAARDVEDLPSATEVTAPVPSAQPASPSLLALTIEPKKSAPVPVASNAPRDSAPSAIGARPPVQSTPIVPSEGANEITAPPGMFSAELQVQSNTPAAIAPVATAPVAIAPAAIAPAASAPAANAPAASAPAAPAPMPMSNPETGARVTKIEFYETGEKQVAPELPTTELSPEPRAIAEGEAPSADATSLGDASSEGSATSEREPAPEAQTTAPAVSAPRFEVTEGKGMRGLDAVVASLLRPYAEKSESKVGARVPTASAPHVSVETGKSQNAKVDERVVNVSQALDAAALRRQEEERSGELGDAAPAHLPQHVEMRAEAPSLTDNAPAPTATPLNVPVPMPDPDAAMMGKLVRGESLNAAISIEHPELGSMEVVVQNQNGRIDVRATLETPRAAAVLRAHESALRYGVQQAGMTLGALRVNARTGEAKVERSRDVTKRRRDRDWEA